MTDRETMQEQNSETPIDPDSMDRLDSYAYMFKKGFMVAMNFLHHHDETRFDTERSHIDKERFELVLKLNIPDKIAENAINVLSGDGNCPPGWCDVGGGRCELCLFKFAYEQKNFPNFPVD